MEKRMSKSLGLVLAFALSCAAGVGGSAQTLRRRADAAGVLVGAAVDPRRFDEPAYASTLAREFNMVEPENVLKWGTLRPGRDTFDFSAGDRVVRFARAHGMKVRGHCLLWSEYNPAWLSKGGHTPEQLNAVLREHVFKVMRHYSGRVFAWDVVNESFLADGSVEESVWYDSPGIGLKGKGTAYIEQAFRWAREADPKALLFYNDYDTEGVNPKSDAVYEMVRDFRARGVPIDGVGIQAHIMDLDNRDIETFAANLERLAALGLQIHITEMDVGLPVDARGELRNPEDLKRQAEIYRHIAEVCFRQPKCTAFQTWGLTDKYSWIPDWTKGKKGAPLLFDKSYAPKPAYASVAGALDARRRPRRTRRKT
jgi:endo-1,4-beta-xylanase